MNIKHRIESTILSAILGLNAYAVSTGEFVTIHCSNPGSLELSDDARIAPMLKVVGNINERDFSTLKQATINVTRVLDLSEAVIHECTVEVSDDSDWMVGGSTHTVVYPANTLPSGAFTELRDNSVSKFIRGSESLTKLILPSTLTGFMEGSLTNNYVLTDIEVPSNSTTLRMEGNLIYSYDGTVLHAMPPAYYGDVTVAASVTEIAPGVFNGMSPASVTFTSASVPVFGENNKIDAAYIVANDPDSYAALYPEIDCISSLETIVVSDPVPGQLLAAIGNLGFSRKDVRSVKVSGEISYEDFTQLVDLPNLHHADLSEAHVEFSGQRRYTFKSNSVTKFEFPVFDNPLALEISSSSRLSGHLKVPEGVWWFGSSLPRFSSAEFPSTIQQLDDPLFRSYSVMEAVDFSKCRQLKEIDCLNFAGLLKDVKLPDGLKKLEGLGGPVESINIPNSVEYIYTSGGWVLEKLTLPSSLTQAYIGSLPMAVEIDASNAGNLHTLQGLSNTPNLKTLDLSKCPIRNVSLFSGDMYLPNPVTRGGEMQRIVVSGNTKYPAPNVTAIEDLKLPSTLKTLSGFNMCSNLKVLDLMQCFRLESINGISNCPSLERITLPESVLSISGLSGCQSLNKIISASYVAPSYNYNGNDALDFSQVSLNVGIGCAGAFKMADGWENCREINEVGYRVTINYKDSSIPMTDTSSLLIYGAGLYSPEEEATLTALPANEYTCLGWSVNGILISENPSHVKVEENLIATPIYGIDQDGFDVVMNVYVPTAQYFCLDMTSLEHFVSVDNEKIADYSGNIWVDRSYAVFLQPGEHEVAINGRGLCLHFETKEAYFADSLAYKVTSFKLNNKESLRQIYPRNFYMDRLDLSEASDLAYVSTIGSNRISIADVSDCMNLTSVSFQDSGVETFLFENTPLADIRMSHNRLKSLDLSSLKDLDYLDLSYNDLVDFKMDSPGCGFLDLEYNPMAFSTLTPQIYDIYMRDMRANGKDLYGVGFIIDTTTLDTTGKIDLSAQMTPPGCDVPTEVIINGRRVEGEGNGIFIVPYGKSQIVLLNDAYPDLRYTCIITSEYDNRVKEIVLNYNELTLEEGEWTKLEATILPEDAPTKNVAWSSSDSSIVLVNSDGSIYGISEGEAIVTATAIDDSGIKGQCVVTVVKPQIAVDRLMIDPSSLVLESGETVTVQVYYYPSNATEVDLEWSCDNPTVVEITQESDLKVKVKALEAGTAIITVRNSNGLTATCSVSVESRTVEMEAIVLNTEEISLEEGQSYQLTATVVPYDVTYPELEWLSDDENVAVVDGSGLVTMTGTGETIIHVRSAVWNYVEAECRVNGVAGVDGIISDDLPCDIYSISGELLRKGVSSREIERIAKGTYIVVQGTKRIKFIK